MRWKNHIWKVSVHDELKKYDEAPNEILYPSTKFYRKNKKHIMLKKWKNPRANP